MQQRVINQSTRLPDVNVGSDKGSLRLQFSTRISQKFYNKRQAYKGLGRNDIPENYQWAYGIARRIQLDIDHPDGELFDPSLAKYLHIKPIVAAVIQLPNTKALPQLKELWNEFCEWKLSTGQIKKTTYSRHYQGAFTNILLPYLDKNFDSLCASELIKDFLQRKQNRYAMKTLLGLLSQMCQRAISQKLLFEDYFTEIKIHYSLAKKSKQLIDADDYRSYTIQERNLIIFSMREHKRVAINQCADLVEFLFLTGCRHGEAFALKWKHIKFDTNWIIFKESYDSQFKTTGSTKTDTDRLFKMQGMDRLIGLLKGIHERSNKHPEDLIFVTKSSKQMNTSTLCVSWLYVRSKINKKLHIYPGVVKELADQGKVKYLKPYSTRHTFISIQANNGADLKLLADSCGNSVDVIIDHYLDTNRNVTLKDI